MYSAGSLNNDLEYYYFAGTEQHDYSSAKV